MPFRWFYLPETAGLLLTLWVQFHLGRWLLASRAAQNSPRLHVAIKAGVVVVCLSLFFGFYASNHFVAGLIRSWAGLNLVRGVSLLWAVLSFLLFLAVLLWRRVDSFDPRRRRFLQVAKTAVIGAPLAALGFGVFVQRSRFRVREVDVPVRGLPKDLQGRRLVHLTDIHLSAFLSRRELCRVVDMANETRAQVALVTGDLITMRGDALEVCVRELGRLRAEAGVLGCLGNHELYAGVQELTQRLGARCGIRFLRGESWQARFGDAVINFHGVDHQPLARQFLPGAQQRIVPGVTNILLSHNPAVFDVAERQGWDLTLSGHTHGGQMALDVFEEHLSMARFYTRYVYGLYRKGRASIYVSSGIGTVGVPARIGAPPEVSLIRLCAT